MVEKLKKSILAVQEGTEQAEGWQHKQVPVPPSKGDGYFTPVSARTRSAKNVISSYVCTHGNTFKNVPSL